ncbi:unnamed protein product [Orchesella dallaii]|uniref:RING-type domain-containing protein n=1 Tax=Orchesella dallaii TaxID=48710 RepID=A0ABP1RWF1_9HEXA
MATLCSICQDYLTERPQALQEGQDLIMCALACGHLFHRICVSQWFSRGEVGARAAQVQGNCPCCKKLVSLNHALRIYPTGDEEGDRMVRQDRDLRNAQDENENLTSELAEVDSQLKRTQLTLEEERVGHDMLKMEFGEAASRMDAMQSELQDYKDMTLAVENSLKSILEKTERERNEALRKLTEMEAQLQRLNTENDKLTREDARKHKEIQCLQASLFAKDDTDKKTFSNNGVGGAGSLLTGRGHLSYSHDDIISGADMSIVRETELIELSDSDESPRRSSTSTVSPRSEGRISPLPQPQSEAFAIAGFDAFFTTVKKDKSSAMGSGSTSDSDSANSVD